MDNLKYCSLLAGIGVLFGSQAEASGVRPPYFNSSLQTAFYQAAAKNEALQIQRLLNLGYSIDIADEHGMTALCRARSEGNDEAYELLYKYGANDKAPCMEQAASIYRSHLVNQTLKYGGTLALVGGVAGLFAFADGGSGNGNSGGSSGGGDYVPGSNGTMDNSRDWSTPLAPSLNTYSSTIVTPTTVGEWNNNSEFNGSNFSEYAGSVNYLGSINAAPAFARYYGYDADGNFASLLSPVAVGVVDTGVWGNHSEFKTRGSTKVSGGNMDAGPCLNSNSTNCWQIGSEVVSGSAGDYSLVLTLLDGLGNPTGNQGAISCGDISDAQTCYNKWAAAYPSDYDNKKIYYYYPNLYNAELDNYDALHGSNVAGIIAANIDGEGNMGVAGVNTRVYAYRWDFLNDIGNVIPESGPDLVAVNLSIGSAASDASNATNAATSLEGFDFPMFSELLVRQIVLENGKRDGTIVVKAAGNDGYSQPDLASGLKLNSQYENLLMMVVVSADVTLGSDYSVQNYTLSSFSNQCGATSGYCIAAPGGNLSGDNEKFVWSVGETGSEGYYYTGMAGTSQAAPVVTGAIAFLKGAYNYMSGEEIIDLLMTTANKNASDYSAEKYGAGLLDLGRAVNEYVSDSGEFSTVSGTSFSSERINMSATHINVPAMMKTAVLKALPQNVTIFDKYNRPFDFAAANVVSTTHGSYKNLKNDVLQIARPAKITKAEKGNMSFTFAGSSNAYNGSGLGFMQADYKDDNRQSGFYFNENTRYNGGESFADALANPFMAMQNAYGVYNTFNFNDNVGLKMEAVTGRNGLYDGENSFQDNTFKKQSYALNSELQLHKGQNFGFSLISGVLYEEGAALGLNGSGAFKAQNSSTYNTGIRASWFVTPKLTLSGSYYRGYTQGQSFASDLLETSSLTSESFAFDANYKLDKQTSFGFKLTSPLRVVDGKLLVNFPSGRDNYSDTVYFNRYQAALKPEAREYKLALYAGHEFSERFSVRSEIGMRINPEHQRQANDYQALFGLNWCFN